MPYKDTYFLSYEKALEIAKQQNKLDIDGYKIQICYYDGEKKENNLDNLIHLPLDNFIDSLSLMNSRIPTQLNFLGFEFSEDILNEIQKHFIDSIKVVKEIRRQIMITYIDKILNQKLDFKEPLRFFLMGHKNTRVMRYVSQNIHKTLLSMGYESYFHLQKGTEFKSIDIIKKIAEFKPHVTININNLNNNYINENCFNFIWFQDPMPILTNEETINLREKDFFFSYQTIFDEQLKNKGIPPEKIQRQYFGYYPKDFLVEKNIKRENKIVFVGSYYEEEYILNSIPNKYKDIIFKELKSLLENKEEISKENIISLFHKHNLKTPSDININLFQQSIVRNTCVQWLSEIDYKKEIYGYGWEKNKKLQKYSKGPLDKANIKDLYNEAKYVLLASGQVINTERLAEAIICGAIPLCYDSRNITNEPEHWNSEILYFKTKEDLEKILKNNIKPKNTNIEKMKKFFSYEHLVDKITSTIKKELERS